MAFEWKDFITVAESLTVDTQKEEFLRSAVGRSYYALFGHALEFAKKKFQYTVEIGHSGSVHKSLRNCYQKRGRKFADVYYALSELHEWRSECDYNLVLECDPNSLLMMAKNSISKAQKMIHKLNSD